MKYNILLILALISLNAIGQNTFVINNSTTVKVTNSSNIHLKNTKLENNGTFDSGNGTVVIEGDAASSSSTIGGANQTNFYNLTVNKSTNNAQLSQNISVNNQMTLTSGKLIISNHDLTMGNSASFSNINKDRYIQTDGTGFLIRQVGNTWVAFPVGNSTFNPARLKNDGTVDNFKIRVRDNFLQDGTSGSPITTNVIPRTWLIEEETIGGSDVSMRLIWRPLHHNNNGFNTNASEITHYTGGNWQDQAAGASTADNSYSSDHRYREATNITSFSPFGVKSGASLPVELLYFYGEREGENVRLDWQTATELNNSHFDVEWSTDGINFEKIGQVAGAGTTNDVQFYDFLHINPSNGQNYYRLKQVDFDGKFEYTNIINIRFEQSNSPIVKIYPNPASYYLNIESENTVGEMLQVFSVNGQLILEANQSSPMMNLSIANFPSGTYFVKIGDQVKRLVIQK